MKNTLICKTACVLVMVLLCYIDVSAQSGDTTAQPGNTPDAAAQPDDTADGPHFEGVIEYKMQFEGTDLPPEIKTKLPREFTIYLKDTRSRLEMETGITDITVLGDNASNSAVTLMDIMGNKLAIKTDSAQLNDALERFGAYEIQYLGDEKEIMGYHCKKALIIRGSSSDTSRVWYTKELLPIYPSVNQFLPKGNWFPMEVHAKHEGIQTTLTVQSINKGPLEDSLFTVPEGYKIMEQDKIREQLLGL